MNAHAPDPSLDELRAKLAEVRSQASNLEEEIARLEKRGQLELPSAPPEHRTPQSPAEKVALFLELFGTRRSVFPKRWENAKTGKSGYAPACDNEWRPGICRKPQIKCTECPHQKFPPLDDRAIEAHLRGIHTLGVYAITDDNSCRFLAADFDGDGWTDNIAAYRDAGSRAGVTVVLERSRSGRGGHAWIFFSEPVSALLARKLGVILLAKSARVAFPRSASGLIGFASRFPKWKPSKNETAYGGERSWHHEGVPRCHGTRTHRNSRNCDGAATPRETQSETKAGFSPRQRSARVRHDGWRQRIKGPNRQTEELTMIFPIGFSR